MPTRTMEMIIDVTENEDFNYEIKRNGMDPSDFEYTVQEDPWVQDIHPLTGKVTIKRKSTGVEKTYPAGHGSSWPAQFSDDLKHGVYN